MEGGGEMQFSDKEVFTNVTAQETLPQIHICHPARWMSFGIFLSLAQNRTSTEGYNNLFLSQFSEGPWGREKNMFDQKMHPSEDISDGVKMFIL